MAAAARGSARATENRRAHPHLCASRAARLALDDRALEERRRLLRVAAAAHADGRLHSAAWRRLRLAASLGPARHKRLRAVFQARAVAAEEAVVTAALVTAWPLADQVDALCAVQLALI